MLDTLKKTGVLLTALMSISVLSACHNTVEGVGDDIEQAGDPIEDATD